MQLGDDAAIKSYLASRLALALRSEQDKILQITNLLERVDYLNKEITESEKKLFVLETRMESTIQEINATHTMEVNKLNEKHMKETRQLYEESTHTIEQLQATINALKSEHSEYKTSTEKEGMEFTKQIHQLEAQLQETARNLTLCRQDRDRWEVESNDHLQKLTAAEKEKSDLQVEYMRLEGKYRLLEQRYEDMQQQMLKIEESKKLMQENKKSLEDHIEYQQRQQQEMQAEHQLTKQQLQEAFQKFEILKTEYNRAKEMILKKNEVIKKQEALVIETREKTGDYERLYKEEVTKSENQANTIKTLKKELREMTIRYKEANIQAEKQKKMSEYLSQELLQFQHGFPIATANPFSSPNNTPQLPPPPQSNDALMNTPTATYQTPASSSSHPYQTTTTNQTTMTTRAVPATSSSIAAKYQLSPTATTRPTTLTKTSPPSETGYTPSSYFPQQSNHSSNKPSTNKLLQGMQSLGLSASELNVNLDELNESEDFSSSGGISSLGVKSKSRLPTTTTAMPVNDDISLEDIDFYSTKR